MVLSGIVINPRAISIIQSKINRPLKKWISILTFFVCFALLIAFSPSIEATPETIDTPPIEEAVQPSSDSNTDTVGNSSSKEAVDSTINSSINESNELVANTSEKELQSEPISVTGNLKVHFLDVGQGDSIFIELPNKQAMLIDAGNLENGSQIVKYIKDAGYTTLDYVVATHPHSDHIGGMATVINDLNINKFYMIKKEHTTEIFEDMLIAIQNKGLGINTAKAGVNILNESNLKIDILAPVGSSYEDLNDYSAIINLTYGNKSFLFIGDAESVSEGQITAKIKADVLKVGHHGSDSSTSSSFLSTVSPKYAVISVGTENSYGHPTYETLTELNDADIEIFRTDESGTITFTTDGSNISVDKEASSIKEQAQPLVEANSTQTYDSTPVTSDGYIGNINTKKFHRTTCSSLPATKNQVILNSREKAIAQGYVGCKRCNP